MIIACERAHQHWSQLPPRSHRQLIALRRRSWRPDRQSFPSSDPCRVRHPAPGHPPSPCPPLPSHGYIQDVYRRLISHSVCPEESLLATSVCPLTCTSDRTQNNVQIYGKHMQSRPEAGAGAGGDSAVLPCSTLRQEGCWMRSGAPACAYVDKAWV